MDSADETPRTPLRLFTTDTIADASPATETLTDSLTETRAETIRTSLLTEPTFAETENRAGSRKTFRVFFTKTGTESLPERFMLGPH